MARAALDAVEGDFEDGVGLDLVEAADPAGDLAEEMVGEGFDLGVGEAGVGFPDDAEGAGVGVAKGERVVAEDPGSAAMAVFGADKDAVEGGHGLLELDP